MNNQLFHLPKDSSPQARSAFRVNLIGFIAAVITASFYLYLALRFGNWQLYAWSADIWVLALAALIGLIMVRRGFVSRGVWLLLVAVQVTFVAAVFLISGIGLLLAVSMAILVAVIAGQALQGKQARQATILVVGSTLVAILVDQFLPPYRLPAPALINVFLPVILGIVILVLGYTTAGQFRDYSMQTKLLIGFIGITLVAVVSLGIYFNFRLSNVLTQNTQQNLNQLADQTALAVDTFIENQLKSVSVDSQNPLYAQFLSSDPTLRAGSAEESNALTALTVSAHQDTTFINAYALLDNNGIVVLDTATNRGQDESQMAFFKDAVAKDQSTVTGPLFDQNTGRANLYFSAPIKNQAGDTLGVLVADYNANVIESLVESLIPPGNPDNILFRVVDKNNFVRIAHTDNLSLLYKSYKNITPDQIVALQKQGLLPPGSPQDFSTAIENDTVAGLENLTQSPFFTTTSQTLGALTLNTAVPIKTVPWIALVRQSNITVTAPLENQTRTDILISLLLLGVVALAALGLSQILVNPVKKLASVAQEIAAGDISARADITSRDEIGALASTFNAMTDQLTTTLQSLDRRAKQIATSAEVGRRLSAATSPTQLVIDVVEQLQEAFNYYHAHIYFIDEKSGDLVMAGGTGEVGAKLLASGHKVSKGRGLVGRAAETNAPILIEDVSQAEGWLPNPLLPDTKSEVAIPISAGKQVLGVLDVQQNIVNGLSEEDVSLLQSLAGQITISLQNTRSYEQTRAQAELESTVNAIGQKIQSASTVEGALQTAIRELGVALGATRVKANIGIAQQTGDNAVSNN